jgi:hypothetical protein
MVFALEARQFLHLRHSAFRAVMLCIWWDMEGIVHYKLLERNLIGTAECFYQQLYRLEEAIQQESSGG